jgi:hypothetical protein
MAAKLRRRNRVRPGGRRRWYGAAVPRRGRRRHPGRSRALPTGPEITRAGQPPLVCRPRDAASHQSCAGASNDDHRNASGHRGRVGPHRLCDGSAPTRGRLAGGTVPAVGAPPGRSGRASGRAGSGPGGAGNDRAVPPAGTGEARAARPGPPARRAATVGGLAPAPPATAPGAPALAAPTRRDPRRVGLVPRERPPEHGCLLARQPVWRLAAGQPGGGRLQAGVRPLRRSAERRRTARRSRAPWGRTSATGSQTFSCAQAHAVAERLRPLPRRPPHPLAGRAPLPQP